VLKVEIAKDRLRSKYPPPSAAPGQRQAKEQVSLSTPGQRQELDC